MAAVLSPHHLDLRVLAPLLQDLSQPPSFVTADPQASGVTTSPPMSGDEHTDLGALPDEVLLAVASHLGARGLGNLAQVDRRLRAIAEDDMLWKELFDGRFDFRPSDPPSSWKLAYLDYATTPRWHPTQKHPDLIVKDCGLVATMPTTLADLDTDNRTIRAMIDYKPGTGLHYFEVTSLCPTDVGYHPYVGICSSEETVPVTQMQMWHSELCYAYGGNGTLYSSLTLECHLQWLGKYKYGDLVGVLIDYREEECGWLTFFLNKEAVSQRIRITGTWFPCVGMFHPRHAMRIEVRPQVPEQETADA